jgi:hypothetical protein
MVTYHKKRLNAIYFVNKFSMENQENPSQYENRARERKYSTQKSIYFNALKYFVHPLALRVKLCARAHQTFDILIFRNVSSI